MSRSISAPRGQAPYVLLLLFSGLALLLMWWLPPLPGPGTGWIYARSTESSDMAFDHEVTLTDVTVDWTPADGGDFDPRGKCPKDFFKEGFVVLCRKKLGGESFKFMYHKGKKLLYRIDQDVIGGKAYIGLHWVESTLFGARYRIADQAFKKGKRMRVPTGTTTYQTETFRYGQTVSKRRSRPDRIFFHATHIKPEQCDSWWDIFTFHP